MCLISPISCWRVTRLSRHPVRLINECQSVHHSQSKVVYRISLLVRAYGVYIMNNTIHGCSQVWNFFSLQHDISPVRCSHSWHIQLNTRRETPYLRPPVYHPLCTYWFPCSLYFMLLKLFFDTLGCLEKESSRSMSSKLRTLYPSIMPWKYASSTRKVRVLDIFSSCTNKNYKADFAYPIVGLLAERGKLPALSQRFWEFAPRRDLFSNLLGSPQLLQL